MEETNSRSITAFTLGILSIIIPAIGLILGIIGLMIANRVINEVGHSNGRSSSLAVSGRILSIIGICLQVLYIVFAIIGIVAYSTITSEILSM